MVPGFTPRIDGFRGDAIGAIYATRGPQTGAVGAAAAYGEQQEANDRRRHEGIAERKRWDEQRTRDRDAFLHLVEGVKDPFDRLRFVIHLLTRSGEAGKPVPVSEGAWMRRALPDLFPRTVHCLSPFNTDHAPWDSEQIAFEFANRMHQNGTAPEDGVVSPLSGSDRLFRVVRTPERIPCWRFGAGLMVGDRAAYITADGGLHNADPRKATEAPRLNVHALHRITTLLGVPVSDNATAA